MGRVLLHGWSTGLANWRVEQGLSLFGMGAVAGFLVLLVRRESRTLAQLLIWLGLPLLALWFVSLRGPIFTDRYLIWSAPAFYLLVGSGLFGLRRWVGPVALVLAVLLLMWQGANLYYQVDDPIKPEFREVAALLARRRLPRELLLFQIPYNHRVVDYYLPTPLAPWAEAPYTNWRDEEGGYLWGEGDVDASLRSLVTPHRTLWLIYSEVAMWDERELVKGWLDERATLLETHSFQGVTLYRYALP
jgi:hypothetical protein